MISPTESPQKRHGPSALTSLVCVLGIGLGFWPSPVESQTLPPRSAEWDGAAAADYLDGRQAWWETWPVAERDHETSCVSCHTTLPYALARPALRPALGETGPSVPEVHLLEDVEKRVALWNEVDPFYPDQTFGLPKASESRGVEAILNALILSNRDAHKGHLTSETREAFENLWLRSASPRTSTQLRLKFRIEWGCSGRISNRIHRIGRRLTGSCSFGLPPNSRIS